jgi:N-acyl-D-amino-acid deacylase
MLDLLLRGGLVIDGSGNPGYRADVGVEGDRIVLPRAGADSAQRVIDAEGLLVMPGFIDPHSHSDFVFFREPRPDMKLRQGVTTEIVGNCGSSSAPILEKSLPYLEENTPEALETLGEYSSFGEYLERVQKRGLINNQAFLVGHKLIRTAVLGMEARPASPAELERMKEILATALDEGAMGMSSGLLYPPMCFAAAEEVIELCRVVAEKGKIFACHMRNYSSEIVDALNEMIELAKRSGAPVHVSHFMLAGKSNWGKAAEILAMIDQARADGADLTLDQYPYTAANPYLRSMLPTWMHEGGSEAMLGRLGDGALRERAAREMEEGVPGWESIAKDAGWENLVVMSPKLPEVSGQSLRDIAASQRKAATDTVFDLLLQDPGASLIAHWVKEKDVVTILRHHCQMVSTDSAEPGPLAHPRAYGSFPKIFGEYVRTQRVLSWEEAARKTSNFAARRFGLDRRGMILDGWHADLVALNPDTVAGTATFGQPDRYPVGIEYVIVNGKVVVEGDRHSGDLHGRVLTHPS